MACYGSHEECGANDHDTTEGVVCGFCHPELIEESDRQIIRDFERFLNEAAPAIQGRVKRSLRWQWIEYIFGRMPAPPLMWEGDDG